MTRRIFGKILLVVVVVLGLVSLSGILQAAGSSGAAFERVKAVQAAHTNRLMAIQGVVGTGIGLDGSNTQVLKVFLEKGGIAGIPGKLDGVIVQPVVTGAFYALPKRGNGGGGGGGKPGGGGGDAIDPTARFDRPVPIGVSTGHPDITAGTIGCRVTDGTDVYALSNNHVYANQNDATVGDAVIQPGSYDNGVSPADNIGTLAEFKLIAFYDDRNPPNPIPTNTIDAAIALVTSGTNGSLGNATPSNGYGTPQSATGSVHINQKVKKYGRTTGQTKGQVIAINATVDVGYGVGKVARFVGQIVVSPGSFSAGGDSGSLIVVDDRKGKKVGPDDRKPIGLLFAGSALYTIANPINDVLTAFGVTIDGD